MIMQRQHQHHQPSQDLFAVSELAQFEYCPLLWWHEQFDPLAQSDTDELFARMVELEHDHGQPATTLPDYQVIEQLLLRRGAFDAGQAGDPGDDEVLSEREEELIEPAHRSSNTRTLALIALTLLVLALLLIGASFLLAKVGGSVFPTVMLPTGLTLLVIALILLLLLLNERRFQQDRLENQRRRDLGLPSGELVYEDADGEGEPLSSREAPLAGKPTYIIQLQDGRPIPIEVKPGVQNLKQPESNHIIQIGAYCLILEDYFEVPPTHGVLRYADHEFVVDYTPALRKKVLRLLKEMANCSEDHSPSLTRQRATKCRACLFQPICPVGQGK
jgi:CRISPR-associated exonuclease Cas4